MLAAPQLECLWPPRIHQMRTCRNIIVVVPRSSSSLSRPSTRTKQDSSVNFFSRLTARQSLPRPTSSCSFPAACPIDVTLVILPWWQLVWRPLYVQVLTECLSSPVASGMKVTVPMSLPHAVADGLVSCVDFDLYAAVKQSRTGIAVIDTLLL